MKKIYLALLALTLGVSAQAQRDLKLSLSIANPTFNQNITTGSTVSWSYVIKNNSLAAKDSLQKGDTIKLFDPTSKFDGTKLSTYSYNLVLSTGVPMGGTLTVTPSTPLAFADILTLADPADGLKYKSAPFTSKKQYAWFASFYQISIPAGNIAIASTSTASGDTGLVWINKAPAGINEITFSENIKTFPNPAVNTLSFEYAITDDKAVATIMDLAGRTVLVKELEKGGQKYDLDITTIQNGVYFLHLNVGEKTLTGKFNVQK